MTKTCKNLLLSIVVAVCLVACLISVVACDDPTIPNNAVTYTITVQTDANSPASGVKVQIRKGGVTFGDAQTTDEQGKATFELAPDKYDVTLTNLPDGYHLADNTSLSVTEENRKLTVTLEKNFAYTVKLVDQKGAPYYKEGVSVMICTIPANGGAGNCLAPVDLGSNGIATIEADPDNYHVKINDLPQGVEYECDEKGYYSGKNFSATETEMTIVLTVREIISVTDSTPMTTEEKTAYAQNSSYTADPDITAYYFKATLKAGEASYYSITPEFDGDYMIYYNSGNASNYLFSGDVFSVNSGRGLYSAIEGLEAGKTYYFIVLNNNVEASDFEFVIEAPAASSSRVTLIEDVNVTIAKKGANAIIELVPSVGAAFKLTAPADLNASIIQVTNTYNVSHPDESYKTGAECTARFTEDQIGTSGIIYFSVAVKGVDKYPLTFKVTIEKTANLKNTTNVKHAEAKLEAYGDQQGSLTYIPMDGTATLTKDNNGVYHLGDENGPVVVVLLTKSISSNRFKTFEGGSVAYIDNADDRRYSLIIDETVDKTSLTNGNTYNDYRLMIRGFADYKQVATGTGYDYVIPDAKDITETHYYAKYVNNDGVYPLTDELKAFLAAFANAYPNNITATAGNEWLFACCYYKAETQEPIDKDAIVGEYVQESMAGNTALSVNEDGTFTIAEVMGSTSGTWENNGNGTYTFTENNATFGDIVYIVTVDAQTKALTFFDIENDPDMEDPYYEFTVVGPDAIIGEYVQESMAGNTALSVNEDGTFTIAEAMGSTSGTWENNGNGTYTFTESNPTWGDIVYIVTVDAQTKALTFYDIENDPDMEDPCYEFTVVGPDAIIGEYVQESMAGNTALSVNEDGTFTIAEAMGSTSGTWENNGNGTYTFTENNATFGDIVYIVTVDAQTKALTFYDIENDPDMEDPYYEFDVVAE